MRPTLLLAALLVAVALAAVIVVRQRDATPVPVDRGTATLVGDSLNIGVERYLPAALPHWRIVANDRVGRSTSEGIAELAAGRPPLSSYVVISLGTNDPPEAIDAFRADVARVMKLVGPDRCVIWATIWRDGAPDDAFNDILRRAAESNPRLRLVAWAEMVKANPAWLAGDGLHGNETGYQERAQEVAAAVRSCTPAASLAKG